MHSLHDINEVLHLHTITTVDFVVYVVVYIDIRDSYNVILTVDGLILTYSALKTIPFLYTQGLQLHTCMESFSSPLREFGILPSTCVMDLL